MYEEVVHDGEGGVLTGPLRVYPLPPTGQPPAARGLCAPPPPARRPPVA
ncbi:hypothetical protein, partial [Clavibacter michiganensis]